MVDLPSTSQILAQISSTSVPFFTDLVEIALPITGIVLAGIVLGGMITFLIAGVNRIFRRNEDD